MARYGIVLSTVQDDTIAQVRRYNRCYTQWLGLLDEQFDGTPWSLTEARLLYELAHRDAPTAGELARDLRLDTGYVSRILHRFEAAGLIDRRRDQSDARRSHILLTPQGRQSFADLDQATRSRIATLIATLSSTQRRRLVGSMATIHDLLEQAPADGERREPGTVVLREPRPGDVGWVVERHGALYAAEFGYDATFEGLVAKIAGEFLASSDATRERGWIAEHDGARVGAVFLVRIDDATAKLRLLFVEPAARGIGVGASLVAACTTFATAAGYRRIRLWTQSHLAAARRLYVNEGYQLVATEAHRSFGLDLEAETWELEMRSEVK